MEFKVARLRETLDILKPVVPKKPTVKVLVNILVQDGKALATDLESAVIMELPEAQGACLLPCEPLAELLKYVPGNEHITIVRKRGQLNLTWPGGSASYEDTDPKDYPPVSDFEVKVEGALDGDLLVATLVSAAGYCATEKDRPVLNGVALQLGEPVECNAGDGYRMAHQVLPMVFPGEALIIVPASAIRLLAHFWAKAPKDAPVADSLIGAIVAKRELTLSVGDEYLKAQMGQTVFITRLTAGSPPDFRKLLPAESPPTKAFVLAPDLDRAVRRVHQVSADDSGIVRLVMSDGNLIVSAKNDKQQVQAEVTLVSSSGEPGKVAINGRYLLDYLLKKEGVVTIGIRDAGSPVLFEHQSSPLVLVMPMHVEW